MKNTATTQRNKQRVKKINGMRRGTCKVSHMYTGTCRKSQGSPISLPAARQQQAVGNGSPGMVLQADKR
jgi:hypothetical protein